MFMQSLERRFEKRIHHSPDFALNVMPKKNDEVYMSYSDIVKVCKNCGPLLLDKTVFRKINGIYGAQCKNCTALYQKKSYQKQMELHKSQLESGEFFNISPAKICKVHGELPPDQIQLRGRYKRCRLCMCKNKQRWEKENFQKVNEGKVKRYYKDPKKRSEERVLGRRNLTQDIYYKMFEDQNYTCAICKITKGQPISKTKNNEWPLCIDHCHKTNKVRKLLCRQCNSMLGNAKDSVKTLQEAINYLKEFVDDKQRE